MELGNEWSSKCFEINVKKGQSIDKVVNNKKLCKLLDKNNKAKKDFDITVDYDKVYE